MTGTPRVTVIIPVRNGERYIASSVNSILSQTFTDLELLVIDDGSEDLTRSILSGIARENPRLKVVEKTWEGVVPAMNSGIAMARGEFIARLDHDDIALPNRIQTQVEFLDANPEFLAVGCHVQNIDSDGRMLKPPRIRNRKLVHSPASFPPKLQWMPGPTPLMRTHALRKIGGYRPQFSAAEDVDLCWRLGAEGRLERLPQVLVLYRRHRTNMSVLARRTQIYSAMLATYSAVAAHFNLDDRSIVERIDVGGDYRPVVEDYRKLLEGHFPFETYRLLHLCRTHAWDCYDFPSKHDLLAAVIKHVAANPLDPNRLHLLRKALRRLTRKEQKMSEEF